MRVLFWGVRGSLPSPLLPSHIKSRISASIERLTPGDLESPESRERFLANLPPWIFGTIGGNTPCVEVQFDNESEALIFDAGSGIRELGIAAAQRKPKPSNYHIFFSHSHWDHIMGLPFFGPAYDPAVTMNIYSPMTSIESALQGQMAMPYFPVHMDAMASKKIFRVMDGPLNLLGADISFRAMNHPGDSFSFKVEHGNRKFIYATDTELSASDFNKDDDNNIFFADADLLVIDSQYTLGEAIEKFNWGHSSFSLAVDFAVNWNIKHMVMFHHDPAYDDHKLYKMLQSAYGYTERMGIKGITLSLAIEGLEITL